MGPCETQNAAGLLYVLDLGAELTDEHGDSLAPVGMVLETYARNPSGKHACLEVFAARGVELPDTPPMAIHRGRCDLLERHLARDSQLLARTFDHEEIYPPQLGCHRDHSLALHGTPVAGGTLLHLCVDFDEIELARWLIDRGADVNTPAAIDADGFRRPHGTLRHGRDATDPLAPNRRVREAAPRRGGESQRARQSAKALERRRRRDVA
jgi:hypothetical protein